MKHFEINDGKEIIRIGFDENYEFEYLSIYNPITFLWRSEDDDYDELDFSLLPLKNNDIFDILNNSFNKVDFYADFSDNEEELYQIIKPFLLLFKNGKYGLNFIKQLTNISGNIFLSERPNLKDIQKKIYDFEIDFSNGKSRSFDLERNIIYEFDYDFISIKSESEIDLERVRFFENQIKEGKRPFAIIFSGQYGEEDFHNYILDGHHKIIAYQNLNIKPPYLLISYFPENSSEIKLDVEYLLQNFYPQIFQNWESKNDYLKQNPNSVLQKFVKNGKFGLYNSYTKFSEGNYVNDLPDGEHISYFSNGKLLSIRHYNKGLPNGKQLFYNKNGEITHENIFNEFNKQISGKWFYEGKQMHENIWDYDKNGNLISFKHFDEFTNLINENNYENNIPIIHKSFERDGEIKELQTFDDVEKRLISVPLNEDIILEHSTEKYKGQKRRIKAWHEKNDKKIAEYKEAEELRKKLDDSIETMNFTDNLKIIALVIIVLIILFNFKSLFG